jgi:hypothetical protein
MSEGGASLGQASQFGPATPAGERPASAGWFGARLPAINGRLRLCRCEMPLMQLL